MPRVACSVMMMALLLMAFPLMAEEARGQQGDRVSSQLQALSKKVDELQRQNRTILENQAKILQELETLKVRIRRS